MIREFCDYCEQELNRSNSFVEEKEINLMHPIRIIISIVGNENGARHFCEECVWEAIEKHKNEKSNQPAEEKEQ